MSERYEIQGRIVERRAGVVVRDEARPAVADSPETAMAKARGFVDAGMTVWMYSAYPQPGRTALTYRRVAHRSPPRRPDRADAGGVAIRRGRAR